MLQQQLHKARKQLELLSRYAEDVEDERDASRKELKAKEKQWRLQAKELQAVSKVLGKVLEEVSDVSEGPSVEALPLLESVDGLIPVANMMLQDLRDECVVRGLPVEGTLLRCAAVFVWRAPKSATCDQKECP